MKRLSLGQVVLLATLIILLILSMIWAVSAWNDASSVEMSIHGWIALGLGTFFSLLIGCGLMALMFYSDRSGHDDVADPFRRRKPPGV
jgi:TRAP-type C4-dicarboxylate transport system permease small subunit